MASQDTLATAAFHIKRADSERVLSILSESLEVSDFRFELSNPLPRLISLGSMALHSIPMCALMVHGESSS